MWHGPVRLRELQDREYTGANRCSRCTILNVALAVVGAVGIAVSALAFSSPLVALLGGGLFLVISSLAILLKGYFVPGTPTLTKRYMPRSMYEWFREHTTDETDEIQSLLQEHGVLDANGDDVRLDSRFRKKLETVELEREHPMKLLKTVLDIPEDEFHRHDSEQGFVASIEGNVRIVWPSAPALHADAEGASMLAEHDWFQNLGTQRQFEVLERLRLLRETCPACGGEISLNETRHETCCSEYSIVRSECGSCDETLLSVPA